MFLDLVDATKFRGGYGNKTMQMTLMNRLEIFAVFLALGAVIGAAAPAHAKGCIEGAVVGGVAGHMVGHGAAGAAVVCHWAPRGQRASKHESELLNRPRLTRH